jgi:branched-chain amino acid transport system substrate-binding protein
MKNKILLLVGILVIVIILIGSGALNRGDKSSDTFTVGAILPLSGPAAAFGEPLKNGMDLVLKNEGRINVIYEDSKALPADGASAYQRLIANGAEVIVSAYSGVSIPLTKLSVQNQIPLIMTIVAADNVTNEYSYRYYANPRSYVNPAFEDANSPLSSLTDIAILYRNDEYGKSVSDIISNTAVNKGKKVTISEAYKINETDFSTHLLKIKSTNPQVVIFVTGSPSEAVSVIKKAYELKLQPIFIEASAALSDPATQKQTPLMTYYTTGFRFSLPDDSLEFKKLYQETYGTQPNFAAAFGYDVANLIVGCSKRIKSNDIQKCLQSTTNIDGITGTINNIKNNEINPPMFLIKVN